MKITRIAPSPTGLFHLGTARTAYYNYLMARSTGGKFVLRIDDTDTDRNKEEYTQVILDSLDWLGLEYDDIYYQSQRLEIYSKVARSLLEAGKAYQSENGALILKCPEQLPESFIDTIAGEIKITDTNRQQIDGTNGSLVLLRGATKIDPRCTYGHDRCYSIGQANCPYCENWDTSKLGQPTYQFCSVVDDYYMGINNIIRGVDHITNTPKQIAIFHSLDFPGNLPDPLVDVMAFPKFTHIGLINKDGKKLSKRDGAASLLWYREQGYTPQVILNWILTLGWALKVPRDAGKEAQKLANEPISKEQAIQIFQRGTMKNSPANYDINKLDWLQKRYR